MSTRLDALLQRGRVIPVITIEDPDHAVPMAEALVAGGLRLLEITLRTSAGLAAAAAIVRAVPDAVVGVGTVLTPDDLHRARDAGAQFALSPGATPRLLDAAARLDIPFMPGIATASELMLAAEYGFDVVKFFPAATMGGLAALRSLRGPFPTTRFCPTGGVSAANCAEWLAAPGVVAVGGSWLTPADALAGQDWARLTALARAAPG